MNNGIKSIQINRGDTLSQIARNNNTTVEQIMALNQGRITDPNLIYEGDTIQVPDMDFSQVPTNQVPANNQMPPQNPNATNITWNNATPLNQGVQSNMTNQQTNAIGSKGTAEVVQKLDPSGQPYFQLAKMTDATGAVSYWQKDISNNTLNPIDQVRYDAIRNEVEAANQNINSKVDHYLYGNQEVIEKQDLNGNTYFKIIKEKDANGNNIYSQIDPSNGNKLPMTEEGFLATQRETEMLIQQQRNAGTITNIPLN